MTLRQHDEPNWYTKCTKLQDERKEHEDKNLKSVNIPWTLHEDAL